MMAIDSKSLCLGSRMPLSDNPFLRADAAASGASSSGSGNMISRLGGGPPRSEDDMSLEQLTQYREIVRLLVAAGYFRGRIQALSPFDKIVGGIAWCIRSANVDVDIDVRFKEDGNIGYQIEMGEHIERSLKRMQCPYPLIASQLRGLDLPKIFPVVQWLVKKAIEVRDETVESVRAVANLVFDREYVFPETLSMREQRSQMDGTFAQKIRAKYGPKRLYRRKKSLANESVEIRVNSVLLEYGKFARRSTAQLVSEDETTTKKSHETSARDERILQEEEDLDRVQQNLDAVRSEENRISSANAMRIVELGSESIRQAAGEYDEKRRELEEQRDRDRGVSQGHKRQVEQLRKRIAAIQTSLEERLAEMNLLKEKISLVVDQIEDRRSRTHQMNEELITMENVAANEKPDHYRIIKSLLGASQKLSNDEADFQGTCREQLADWKRKIAFLEQQDPLRGRDSTISSSVQELEASAERDMEKMSQLENMTAQKNQQIDQLRRAIDDIPTRAELSQYEKRFSELYEQVTSKLEETRNYYAMHNTLDEKCSYMTKELRMMNSVQDGVLNAMHTEAGRDKILNYLSTSLAQILESRSKVEHRYLDEVQRKNSMDIQLDQLMEVQRSYFRTLREFEETAKELDQRRSMH